MGPALLVLLRYRRLMSKEHAQRWREKTGQASLNRPPNSKILWCHAASVGEAKSVLPLIDAFVASNPEWHVLLTTVTITGYNAIKHHLPPRTQHQFAPLDHPFWVQHFLNHWQPNGALWVEGELWPNQFLQLKKRHVPLVLINARMHPKSFASWQKFKGFLQPLLQCITAATAMSPRSANYYQQLGLDNIQSLGDIKMAAAKLPCPAHGLSTLIDALGARPRLLLAQSHEGEEALLLEHFKYLEKQFPQLLLTIVPRHPTRTAQIVAQITEAGLSYNTRGDQHRLPNAASQIYVANTMGELGLFYHTHNIVIMGGSFINLGGHNPLEAAHFGCHIVAGPNMFNFDHITELLAPSGGYYPTTDSALPLILGNLLSQTAPQLASVGEKMRRLAETQQHDIIPQHIKFLANYFN